MPEGALDGVYVLAGAGVPAGVDVGVTVMTLVM